jgi:prephenate dehydratase
LAQCYHFLDKEYKEVIKQEFGSTAAAAKRVAENPEKNMPQLPIYMLQNFTI